MHAAIAGSQILEQLLIVITQVVRVSMTKGLIVNAHFLSKILTLPSTASVDDKESNDDHVEREMLPALSEYLGFIYQHAVATTSPGSRQNIRDVLRAEINALAIRVLVEHVLTVHQTAVISRGSSSVASDDDDDDDDSLRDASPCVVCMAAARRLSRPHTNSERASWDARRSRAVGHVALASGRHVHTRLNVVIVQDDSHRVCGRLNRDGRDALPRRAAV
jgi:hypothetical protein